MTNVHSPASPALFNPEVLSAKLGTDDSAKLRALYELYLEHTAIEVVLLQQMSFPDDLNRLNATAHKLKSSSANVGAEQMVSELQVLETAAQNGDIEAAIRGVTTIYCCWEQTSKAVWEKLKALV